MRAGRSASHCLANGTNAGLDKAANTLVAAQVDLLDHPVPVGSTEAVVVCRGIELVDGQLAQRPVPVNEGRAQIRLQPHRQVEDPDDLVDWPAWLGLVPVDHVHDGVVGEEKVRVLVVAVNQLHGGCGDGGPSRHGTGF